MSLVSDGALFEQLDIAKKEYNAAVNGNNLSLAGEKASKCARILHLLAKDRPSYKEAAVQWENIAKAIAEGRFRRPDKNPVKQDREAETAREEFDDYIKSLATSSAVTWEDIGGLVGVKRLLMENVVIASMKKPDIIKPWHGILFYGPPGTGKTLLAAATAGSLKATFFQASASKMLSKYYGESSKLISALYRVAMDKAEKAPAIIFIDEFDSIAVSRESDISEAAHKTLSTLLEELDGLQTKKSNRLVLTLVTTNIPWSLDKACLSRFPLRIYVSLPDVIAIKEIIKIQTKGLDMSGVNCSELAEKCHSILYSGREISALCQKAIWNMIREENPNIHQLSSLPFEEIRNRSVKIRALKEADFNIALKQIKSAITGQDIKKYDDWAVQFGSN